MIQVLLTVDIMKFKLVEQCFNLMIMKKFLSIRCVLGVLFFALLATSCTEKVNLDPHERGIVVYAMMEDSTVQQVKLFYTSYLSETYYPPVEEAEVYMEKMKDDEAVERYDFHKKEDGLWEADLYPQQLAYYKLTVIIPSNDVITATTQFPLRHQYVRSNGAPILTESLDTKGSTYNYVVRTIFSLFDYIPELMDYCISPYIERYTSFILIGDQLTEFKRNAYLFEDYTYRGQYTINRDFITISQRDSLKYADNNSIFRDGALFGDHGVHAGMAGMVFSARKYFADWQYFCIHPLSYMLVRNVNEDFELYLKSVIAKNIGLGRKDISDLTHIWEKDEIYSNVHNALGIFAAECRHKLMVKDYSTVPPPWEEYNIIIPGWND